MRSIMRLSTLCYIRKGGRTLMLHRVKKENDVNSGKWIGLGGGIEAGETPEEGVVREVQEESGLIIRNPRFRGFLTFSPFEGYDGEYVLVFTVTESEGELIECPEGNLEWVEDDKLLSLELWEGDWLLFEWLEQDRFFSGRFTYTKEGLRDHSVVFY